MKKIFVVIFSATLVVVLGFYGWSWNKNNQLNIGKDEFNKDLSKQMTGVLTREQKNTSTTFWSLIIDRGSSDSKKVELLFDQGSQCFIGSNYVDCAKIDFPNGTRVMVSGKMQGDILSVSDFNTEKNSDLITIDKIASGDKLLSPIILTGRARGNWFFEGSFPVKLIDKDGNTVSTAIATAKGDWMTTDFVPFEAKLDFNVVTDTPAKLIFNADNPSGLPEYDREVNYSVVLSPSDIKRQVVLYYYNQAKDQDENNNILCSEKGLVSVLRQLPEGDKIIFNTINLLLQGSISDTEKKEGVSSEFPLAGLVLENFEVADGVATVYLKDSLNKTVGGACRVGILWKQIEKTVKQFPGIKEVKFLPEELFQP